MLMKSTLMKNKKMMRMKEKINPMSNYLSLTDQSQLYRTNYQPLPTSPLAIALTNGISIPNNEFGIATVEQLREFANREGVRVYKYTVTSKEN